MLINLKRQQSRRSSSMSYFENSDALFQLNTGAQEKTSKNSDELNVESKIDAV